MEITIIKEINGKEQAFDVTYTIKDLAQYFSVYFDRPVKEKEYQLIRDLINCEILDLYEIEHDKEFQDIVWDNHSGEFDI